jgi:hypothetical protein
MDPAVAKPALIQRIEQTPVMYELVLEIFLCIDLYRLLALQEELVLPAAVDVDVAQEEADRAVVQRRLLRNLMKK